MDILISSLQWFVENWFCHRKIIITQKILKNLGNIPEFVYIQTMRRLASYQLDQTKAI